MSVLICHMSYVIWHASTGAGVVVLNKRTDQCATQLTYCLILEQLLLITLSKER